MPQHAEAVRADEASKTTDARAATPAHKDSARPRASAPAVPARHAWSSDRVVQLKRGNGPDAGAAVPNRTGLPDSLKAGVESLSGLAMDDVRVHRNSSEPAKLGALAYTKGSDIHLGPGQEQHLPHEAWHAVQQKQGRVAATAQLKGMGVNVDAGLEAEADRMGTAAAGAKMRPDPVRLRNEGGRNSALQMKVKLKGTPLKSRSNKSPLLNKYIDAPQEYILRDDYEKKLKKMPIHLIDGRKYYLIGERHDEPARWRRAIASWSTVPRMTEYRMTMPKEPDDKKSIFVSAGSRLLKPLNSTHPHLLTTTSLSYDHLNDVLGYNDTTRKQITIEPWLGGLANAQEWLSNTSATFTWYADYSKRYETRRFEKTERLKQIYQFSKRTKAIYDPKIKSLLKMLKVLRSKVKNLPRTGPGLSFVATNKSIEKSIEKIADGRKFLTELANEVLKIMNTTDRSEVAAVQKLFSPASASDEDAVLDTMRPLREREMTANVSRSVPPLIIQMGDNHVEGIAKNLGADIAVQVRLGETLGSKTEVAS